MPNCGQTSLSCWEAWLKEAGDRLTGSGSNWARCRDPAGLGGDGPSRVKEEILVRSLVATAGCVAGPGPRRQLASLALSCSALDPKNLHL